jgi:topoisomerase-4 subunit A
VKGLAGMLGEWISFRKETVRKRLEHRLGKVTDRLHILEGLLIAFLNIDEVIAIIRSEDDPSRCSWNASPSPTPRPRPFCSCAFATWPNWKR